MNCVTRQVGIMNIQKCVIGNWKLNPATKSAAYELAQGLSNIVVDTVSVGCAPSFLHLPKVVDMLAGTPIWVGAQDICAHTQVVGAYTGDVSGEQLADVGAKFVIIGHSERRSYYHEDADLLAVKIQQAMAARLRVVFCIGETLADYQAGKTLSVLDEQLAILKRLNIPNDKLIVAYEPVWAIGTGLTPTVEEIGSVHHHIKAVLTGFDLHNINVLYGGSVNEQNAANLAAVDGVDGALVGGASLKIEAFAQIIAAFDAV